MPHSVFVVAFPNSWKRRKAAIFVVPAATRILDKKAYRLDDISRAISPLATFPQLSLHIGESLVKRWTQ